VISHTEAALSAAAVENPVVHVHSSRGNMGIAIGAKRGEGLMSRQENSWYYGRYGTERSQGLTTTGQPVFDTGLAETSETATSILVDYPARVWWQYVQHFPAWTPPPASARSCRDVLDFTTDLYPTEWAADIHKALTCGQFTISGTEQVNGIDAIKLTPVRPDVMTAVLWVDPSTYLPVRVAVEIRTSPGGPFELNHQADVQWLPPTAANLAKLTVPIPPGFAQIPAPPTQGCPRGTPDPGKCFAADRQALAAWYAKYVAPRT
jgi:hypothetical protein